MPKRAHVVQAVGELDEQHANVARDGEQKLAEILGLLRLLGDEVELLDLGEAVDQRADLGPEHPSISLARGAGVLDGVVQQRRGDGGVVEPHLGEDGGDFERMGKERRAGRPLLVAMRLHGVDIGAVEQRLVDVGLVALHPLDQLVLAGHGARHSRARAALAGSARKRVCCRLRGRLRVETISARAGSRIGAI